MTSASSPPAKRPVRGVEILAWCMYDWANSAYSTLSITILVVYLTTVIMPGGAGQVAWAYGIGLTMFVAAILSPIVGAIADVRATKRLWLAGTTLPAAAAAAGMGLTSPDRPWTFVVFFLIAHLGYELSQGFYNGFLPEIADERSMNRVSAWGFALGYIGGGVALILAILVLMFGGRLGLPEASPLARDFVMGQDVEFAVEMPNGSYEVTLSAGDLLRPHNEMQVCVQGAVVDTVSTAKGECLSRTYPATVADGRLVVALRAGQRPDAIAVINGVSIAGVGLSHPLLFDFGTPESAAEPGSIWVTHEDVFAPHDRQSLVEHAKEIPEDELPGGLTYGFLGDGAGLGSRDSMQIPRMQIGLLIMGAWWALFSLPALVVLRDRGTPEAIRRSLWETSTRALSRVAATLRNVRHYRTLFIFLVAFLIYNDGVQTIITQASVYATEVLAVTANELVMVVLMIQFASMPGALLMGWLAGRLGEKRALLICLGIYIAWLFAAFLITTKLQFWLMGVVLALVMGGIQSVSRAIMGLMTPAKHSGEFFGFFNLSGKATSVVGPILFGSILHWTHNAKLAILSLLVFFIVGGLLVLRVDVGEGMRTAQET